LVATALAGFLALPRFAPAADAPTLIFRLDFSGNDGLQRLGPTPAPDGTTRVRVRIERNADASPANPATTRGIKAYSFLLHYDDAAVELDTAFGRGGASPFGSAVPGEGLVNIGPEMAEDPATGSDDGIAETTVYRQVDVVYFANDPALPWDDPAFDEAGERDGSVVLGLTAKGGAGAPVRVSVQPNPVAEAAVLVIDHTAVDDLAQDLLTPGEFALDNDNYLGTDLVAFGGPTPPAGSFVAIEWTTSGEYGIESYSVYRARKSGEDWEPLYIIHDDPIPAEGSPFAGSAYDVVHSLAMNPGEKRTYLLEQLDAWGQSRFIAVAEFEAGGATGTADWRLY